ncbi:hypothetical protein OS493_017813 [Desmophyllum pertusum]|uniref:Uncharacterized protein n=1 Tax=Desmophyllum pertusum TaxID=174260 RepID=A0A9W9ZDK3_9CNID|nr:hypothetical protein OS493_017813 [Desmophyllum pertusum]
MVLRQCLACNTSILGTLQICTCGHVFEDVRQIGGKRFSEYRANLYTRLESKRLKFTEDENKAQSDSDSTDGDPEKQVVLKPKMKSRPARPSSSKPRSNKGKRKRRNAKVTQEHRHGNKTVSLFQSPEEEAARFSRALQEINRRIMGQSMAWLS